MKVELEQKASEEGKTDGADDDEDTAMSRRVRKSASRSQGVLVMDDMEPGDSLNEGQRPIEEDGQFGQSPCG